ncbi:hypothetical protein [Methylorubrum populi]|uniref:hypothetical protein n=1 Tax=Methylorubrum populi TaxID=223967 RepID=UPI001265A765|nr:hypothetical protein [Methylorubrum populi]
MDVALDLAGQVLAERLLELAPEPVTLVPIPNSHAHVGVPPTFRTLRLAEAVAARSEGRNRACPALLWAVAKEKQHQMGGYRSANQFYPNLRITQALETPVVLIDDVVTSGSQMLASAYLLRKAGVTVLFGMAVGRATTEQTDRVLSWSEDVITQLVM